MQTMDSKKDIMYQSEFTAVEIWQMQKTRYDDPSRVLDNFNCWLDKAVYVDKNLNKRVAVLDKRLNYNGAWYVDGIYTGMYVNQKFDKFEIGFQLVSPIDLSSTIMYDTVEGELNEDILKDLARKHFEEWEQEKPGWRGDLAPKK